MTKDDKTEINTACESKRPVAKWLVALFFAAVWLLLTLFEHTQLYRIQDLSTFFTTKMFFGEAMSAPAGLLSYVGAFLVQFFYYPALGAAIYVALLYLSYLLVRKVFAIPERWSLLALLPAVFLLAANTQMGYWIYYIKVPGYYYVALLGFIVVMLALWAYKKLPVWGRFAFIVVWTFAGYPLFGVYALAATVVMAVIEIFSCSKLIVRQLMPLLAVVLVATVPAIYYYNLYTSNTFELMYGAGTPAYQWTLLAEGWYVERVWRMWLPFALTLLTVLSYVVASGRIKENLKITAHYQSAQLLLFVVIAAVTWGFWYTDENFRAELVQNEAIWDEDWERVVEAGNVSGEPTRLVVMNRNIGLLRSGRAGEDMFRMPEGSKSVNCRVSVRLTQTGGKMAYYQYGRFNFCYRWCVEDAVEYGWRTEYLKHAIRSMTATGEYKLAHRYIRILKNTLFHKGWAEHYEKLVLNPKLIDREAEVSVPRQMMRYKNTLDIDDSYVEAYLLNVMTSNLYVNPAPICTEASLMHALIRKDTQLFWNTMIAYLNNHKQMRIPTHYQEALLLYANIDRRADISKFNFDSRIKQRFSSFTKKTVKYKGMTEEQMAPYFKDEFGDTYWYFYFFVREIKSN